MINFMGKNQLSKSKALAAKVIFASLNILKESGGELSGSVLEKICNTLGKF